MQARTQKRLTPLQRSKLQVLQDQLIEDSLNAGFSTATQGWVDVVKDSSMEKLWRVSGINQHGSLCSIFTHGKTWY